MVILLSGCCIDGKAIGRSMNRSPAPVTYFCDSIKLERLCSPPCCNLEEHNYSHRADHSFRQYLTSRACQQAVIIPVVIKASIPFSQRAECPGRDAVSDGRRTIGDQGAANLYEAAANYDRACAV